MIKGKSRKPNLASIYYYNFVVLKGENKVLIKMSYESLLIQNSTLLLYSREELSTVGM
jgi:hypothetical protein